MCGHSNLFLSVPPLSRRITGSRSYRTASARRRKCSYRWTASSASRTPSYAGTRTRSRSSPGRSTRSPTTRASSSCRSIASAWRTTPRTRARLMIRRRPPSCTSKVRTLVRQLLRIRINLFRDQNPYTCKHTQYTCKTGCKYEYCY